MKFSKHYLLWAMLGVLYASLTAILPPDASSLTKYDITNAQARLLSFSFILPYIAIWFAAFYGYLQLKAYAKLIAEKQDGKAFQVISNGLMYLALGLPLSAIITNLLNEITVHNPHLRSVTAVIGNYVGLGVVLLSFYIIHKGTSMLADTVKKSKKSYSQRGILMAYVIFCMIYSYITLTNPARQFPTATSARAAYYLPDALLLLTIVVPYLLVWFWGFQSAYKIHLYKRHVKGIIYKDSLGLLAKGIVSILVAFIFIRFLVSLTTLLNTLALNVILAALYLFLFIIGAGYIMLAVGAKRLKRIEEV
jgi:hypothetical protein